MKFYVELLVIFSVEIGLFVSIIISLFFIVKKSTSCAGNVNLKGKGLTSF